MGMSGARIAVRAGPGFGWGLSCVYYRLAPLGVCAFFPPFNSGALALALAFNPFAHAVAYGDPNRLGLLTSNNGKGFAPYLNSMHGHIRLLIQSCRTIAVGTSGVVFSCTTHLG